MWLLYEDFIHLLREYFDRWPWWINTDGEIRTERDDGEELDPITALYARLHHHFIDTGSYRIAARYLGLDADTADAIAQASDLRESYNAHVRADLIDALGLEEPWGRRGRWGDRAYFAHPYPHGYDRPFHRGFGSAGFASDATRRAPSRFTKRPASVVWRWRLTVSIAAPVDAVSISSGCGDLPPASSSAFSVGPCRPGFAIYSERCAAD
jgi:hypothetical protein